MSVSSVAVWVTRHKSKELSRKQSQQLELLESELRKEIRDGRRCCFICRKHAFLCRACLVVFFSPYDGDGPRNEKRLYGHNGRQLNSRAWA